MPVPGQPDGAVAKQAGRGQNQDLPGPRVLRREQDHEVLLGHGQIRYQIGGAEYPIGKRVNPGVLGRRGHHLGVQASLTHAALVHFQSAGSGKAQAPAGRTAEAAEVAEGGQIAQMKGQVQVLRFSPRRDDARGAGVAVHEQVGHRAQAQRAQQIRPGRRFQAWPVRELAAVLLQVVDGVGGSRQDSRAARGHEVLELLQVLARDYPGLDPHQKVDIHGNGGMALEIHFDDRTVLAQHPWQLGEACRGGNGKARMHGVLQGPEVLVDEALQMGQVGILEPLNEDLGKALQSQHQTGPDLGLAIFVTFHVAHAQRRDPAAGRVSDALGAAHGGIDDAELDPPGLDPAHRLQQVDDLFLDALEARGHAIAGRDEEGEGQRSVESLQVGTGVSRQGSRRGSGQIEDDGSRPGREASGVHDDTQKKDEAEPASPEKAAPQNRLRCRVMSFIQRKKTLIRAK